MLNIELYKAGGTKFFVKIYTLTLLIFMPHLNNGKCIELGLRFASLASLGIEYSKQNHISLISYRHFSVNTQCNYL